ncbi:MULTISPECIES: ROK family protein [Microbacterium]|uniref:ROK family protein n=1 Tax=Microbacterium TaxID=33882 RepID=UPI002782B90A|nr:MULTISPECIES: ROK family protein [Microbacterium]MDQ1085007.1 glucokinase [Microbacterium sp. SORGH_AS_0344]MDQ1169718.1 glucokinase [Microbacterium proteolyticum]
MTLDAATPARPHDTADSRPMARIAVDVGGTTVKGAAFTHDGSVIAHCTMATFAAHRDALGSVRAVVARLVSEVGATGARATGIGVASPGLVDAARGRVVYAANLGWADVDLVPALVDDFGLPVRIEHDARAGAIAERAAHRNEAAAYREFIFVPIGTGVAAAVVTSGALVHGATGGAGEFGHMPIGPGRELCGCGQRGCIEAYASASSVLRRYRARGGVGATTTPELVASLAHDADAASVWADLIEALAIGLGSLSAVLDPARIVIGGGLSQAGASLIDPLRAAIDAKLGWRATPTVVQSALGSHSGLIGAGLLSDDRPVTSRFAVTAASALSSLRAVAPVEPVVLRPIDSHHQ